MNVSSSFGRERVAHPGSFSSHVGQQFHPNFQPSNPRLDRSDGRQFTDFADGIIPQDPIVIDSSSGKILVSPSRSDQEPDPISRFYNGEPPWNPQGMDNGNSYPPTFITQAKQSVVRPHAPYPPYREPARSNPDSHATGRQQPDSGYVTNGPGTKSVISGGEAFEPSDDNHSFIDGIDTMHLQATASNNSYYSGSTHTATSIQQNYNQWPEQEHDSGTAGHVCNFPDCKDETRFKNASELRKHQQRHEKPHKCTVPNCLRKEGFTTKNDLDRHKKSIHHISLPNDRSFRCAGNQCNKRGKTWPRLDNFKSHCHRMHNKEDIDDLIKRSEVEQDRFTTIQPSNGHAMTTAASPYAATQSCLQDASLLVDLSQAAAQSQSPYPSNGRGLVVNRIISTVPVPTLQRPQEPSPRAEVHHEKPLVAQHLEHPHQNSPHPSSRSFPAANGQYRPAAVEPVPMSGSHPSNEGVAEQGQTGSAGSGMTNAPLLVTQAELEICSRQLVADLAKEFILQPPEEARVSKLVDRRMKDFALALGPGRSLSSAEEHVAGHDEPSARPKRVRCRICSKTMDRPCDLKKHEKRHSRPWGCTDAGCNKTFGSKNDWKRHENSQHYQLETWRCHEQVPTSKIGTCAKIFFRRDPFQGHLRRDHGRRDEDYIREQCRKRRIGRNWQNGFWCGFCKAIVKLSTRGLEAWDERFNHIDDCHFKQGQNIDDWYPMDKDVPKGKLKGLQHRHSRRRGAPGGEEEDYARESTGDRDGEEYEEGEEEGEEGEEEDESEPELDRSDDSEVEDYPAGRAKRRRSCNDRGGRGMEADEAPDHDAAQRDATPKVAVAAPEQWYCVHCGYGPMRPETNSACAECGRRKLG